MKQETQGLRLIFKIPFPRKGFQPFFSVWSEEGVLKSHIQTYIYIRKSVLQPFMCHVNHALITLFCFFVLVFQGGN